MPSVRAVSQPALGNLRPPRLGRVFGREHLFAQLEATAAAPDVRVAGSPGIGKTTLVATDLEAREIPCLWLQLDAGDPDPASFVHFLCAAAALVAPRRQLRLPLPGADDLRDVPAFIRRCVRRLAAVLDLPWVLVLDNVQALGHAPLPHAGIAAALTELLGGQIAALVLPEGLFRQRKAIGRLRVLASSGATRSGYFPDVASFVEQGHRDLVVREWFAFFMAARLPVAMLESMSQALRTAIAQPELSAAFAESGMLAASSTPAALAARIAAEQRYWEPIIRASGIRAE